MDCQLQRRLARLNQGKIEQFLSQLAQGIQLIYNLVDQLQGHLEAFRIALMVVAPQYLPAMAEDKDGRWLIVGALLGQLGGYLWMKRIINIKV